MNPNLEWKPKKEWEHVQTWLAYLHDNKITDVVWIGFIEFTQTPPNHIHFSRKKIQYQIFLHFYRLRNSK